MWVALIVIALIIGALMDSDIGQFGLAGAALAVGFLILKWITGWEFFITLAKICAAGIVLLVLWAILDAIF